MAYRDITLMGNGRTAQSSTLTGVVPATAVAGDVAVLCSVTSSNSAATVTLSGGASTWTRLKGPTEVSTNVHCDLWAVQLAAGDLGQTITLTGSVGGWMLGTLVVMSGRGAPANMLSSEVTAATAATTLNSPTIASVPAGADLLTFWAGRVAAATALSVSIGGGQTLAGQAATNDSASPNSVLTAAYKLNSGGGTVGNAVGTYNQSYTGAVAYTVALPAGGDQGLYLWVVNTGGTKTRLGCWVVNTGGTTTQVSSSTS